MAMNRRLVRRLSPATCAFALALGTIFLPAGVSPGLTAATTEAAQRAGDGQAERSAVTPEDAARSYEKYLKTVRNISFHSDFKDRIAEKSSVVAEVALSDIRLAALNESSFQLQSTVPNGLQAHMQDARESVFRWLDGEIALEK